MDGTGVSVVLPEDDGWGDSSFSVLPMRARHRRLRSNPETRRKSYKVALSANEKYVETKMQKKVKDSKMQTIDAN